MWHDYLFTLEEELANIPSVDPAEVAKIEVAVFDSLYHCWGAQEKAKVFADVTILGFTGVEESNSQAVQSNLAVLPSIARAFVNISYNTVNPQTAKLKVYDAAGQLVKTFNRIQDSNVRWNVRDENVSSGIYFVTLETDNAVETKKVTILE